MLTKVHTLVRLAKVTATQTRTHIVYAQLCDASHLAHRAFAHTHSHQQACIALRRRKKEKLSCRPNLIPSPAITEVKGGGERASSHSNRTISIEITLFKCPRSAVINYSRLARRMGTHSMHGSRITRTAVC